MTIYVYVFFGDHLLVNKICLFVFHETSFALLPCLASSDSLPLWVIKPRWSWRRRLERCRAAHCCTRLSPASWTTSICIEECIGGGITSCRRKLAKMTGAEVCIFLRRQHHCIIASRLTGECVWQEPEQTAEAVQLSSDAVKSAPQQCIHCDAVNSAAQQPSWCMQLKSVALQ